jgi:hypothetical protein
MTGMTFGEVQQFGAIIEAIAGLESHLNAAH